MRLVLGCAALVMALPSLAWAQASEAQQRAACTGDAMNYCSAFIPDRSAIARCLAANRNQISPACRSAMGYGSAASSGKKERPRRRSTE